MVSQKFDEIFRSNINYPRPEYEDHRFPPVERPMFNKGRMVVAIPEANRDRVNSFL